MTTQRIHDFKAEEGRMAPVPSDLIIEQTDETVSTQELYDGDHDVWIAQEAARLGFPVAGFVHDIYEDAVILIGPIFRFDWLKNKIKMGRVIHISQSGPDHSVWNFVLLMENGTQVPCSYGNTYDCYFALPENTEEVFRG